MVVESRWILAMLSPVAAPDEAAAVRDPRTSARPLFSIVLFVSGSILETLHRQAIDQADTGDGKIAFDRRVESVGTPIS